MYTLYTNVCHSTSLSSCFIKLENANFVKSVVLQMNSLETR